MIDDQQSHLKAGAFEVHPLAAEMPSMPESEFEELKRDIALHGLKEPIILYRGKLLDGGHQARACHELGIDPPIRKLPTEVDALAFVIRTNLLRRLDSSAWDAWVVKIFQHFEAQAKRRQRRHGAMVPGRSPETPSETTPETAFILTLTQLDPRRGRMSRGL